jgi:hypothetical protein
VVIGERRYRFGYFRGEKGERQNTEVKQSEDMNLIRNVGIK